MKRWMLILLCAGFAPCLRAQQLATQHFSFVLHPLPVSRQLQAQRPIIPPDYYTRQFGFFCRQELRMQQALRVPLSFRLGNMDYCDWMEAKRPDAMPPVR